MIIGIDMGHSLNSGAKKLLNETTENRALGKKLIALLREKGHTVIDCSVDSASSTNVQLQGIVNKANAQPLDQFVSIHYNAGGGHGTETYVYPRCSKDVAKRVNDAIVNCVGFRNRGVKEADFFVLRKTKAPALLVEVCFVDSAEDKAKYDAVSYDAIARAMFKGITGVDYVPPTPPTPPPTSGETTYYRVVAGSYTVRANADEMVNKLKGIGINAFIDIYKK